MTKTLKIIVAQLNFLVGDIHGNTAKIIAEAQRARDEFNGDVIIFPELAITSYPPEDLLLRQDFQEQTIQALEKITAQCSGITIIVGFSKRTKEGLFNAAAAIQDRKIIATYYKQHLPNYGVFDEKRYFTTGHEPCIIHIKGIPIAITICEDLWYPDPMEQAAQAGARMVFSLNASPYDLEKSQARENILRQRIKENPLSIFYVHGVGAQDELVFDGGSMVLNAKGEICAHAGFFAEKMLPVEVEIYDNELVIKKTTLPETLEKDAGVYQALVLGVRDYIEKNHAPGAIIGLSGGIDSALTLTIAMDALGKDRVKAAILPSRYSSDLSLHLAETLAKNLDVHYDIISIEPAFTACLESLTNTPYATPPTTITAQNLQARCRGTLLMAISNQTGKLVLSTSNKSELAMGYSTLYGDMIGGFSVLKDVYKTMVYQLANYRNHLQAVIPQAIINRVPTAELAPDQKDEDSLPPYAVLDKILYRYIENEEDPKTIIAAGFDAETVYHIVNMVARSEYKRRQAPPGIKVTPRAFGRDRRYPITSGFKPG